MAGETYYDTAMAGETFVDVSYRGLELGRRHKLCEVGPTTAYLEYPTPMPVGSRLELLADGGVQLAVEVTRIHEQVAGAERSPGMRVKAPALDERAASLWRSLVSVADPAPIEVATRPPEPIAASAAPIAEASDDDTTQVVAQIPAATAAAAAVEVEGLPPEAPLPPGDEAAEADRRTEVMAAVDIEAIMAQATEPGEASGSIPADDGGANGKKKRGGAGKRKKKT
jgi:hypothetical protein